MIHRKIFICSFIWLLATSLVQAQPNRFGVPIITNYPYGETGGSEQNWCITQDFRGVVYVGNYEKGVLEYDGVEWRTIPVPTNPPILSLATGEDGVVYVGAAGDFGRLQPDRNGKLVYNSLCDSTLRKSYPGFDIHKTYFNSGLVYFCSMPNIFIYDPARDELTVRETVKDPYFSYFVGDTLYHINWGGGLMKWDGDQFAFIPGGEFFKEKSVTGMVNFGNGQLLISTFADGIYLYHTGSGEVNGSFLSAELMDHFRSVNIPYMEILNQDILVTTYSDGLYILNRNGDVKEIISEDEGLNDKTILQVYSDERLKGSGPLWIAHWKGVSKIEANNPFRKFTEESGFEGLISDLAFFNGQLFIATVRGLFYKGSTQSSTGFFPVPGIEQSVYDMQVIEPSRGRSLLLVSCYSETFVIDHQMRVTSLVNNLNTSNDSQVDLEQISGRNILVDPEKPDVIYTGYTHVVGLRYKNGRWNEFLRFREIGEEIFSKGLDKYGYLWVATPSEVVRLDAPLSSEATSTRYTMEQGLPSSGDNQVFVDKATGEVLIGSQNGFYRFNYFLNKFVYDSTRCSVLLPGSNLIRAFYMDEEGDYWYSYENEYTGWTEQVIRRKGDGYMVLSERPFQRLPNASVDHFHSDPERGVWFSKSDELYHFDKSFSRNDTLPFQTLIRKVVINGDSVLFYGTNFKENSHGGYTIHLKQEEDTQPFIKYRFNNIEFSWAAPYFEQEDQLRFSYMLKGFSDDWSEWNKVPFKEFTNLRYGRYTLLVKAMNVYGYESKSASYSFVINRPWYATIPAFVAYILLAGLLVYIIIKLYTRRLKNENLRLEGIIEERTAEIRKQKEELTDSIEYASRIQRALLPSARLMEEQNIDHFILFRPRDIVSGDFYWMGSKNNKLLIVAADCTGHGVPDAFMSMLGMTFLDEIVIKSEITDTAEIMESLRDHVITSLEQSGKSMEEAVKDGMDLAMISMDMTTGDIQFSGAYNPLYLIRKLKRSEKNILKKGEELDMPRGSIHDDEYLLLQVRGDQMPIGVSEKTMPFKSTTIKNEGFNVYMFSDGFLDQFGGPQGKKFMSKNFKKLLLELQSVPLHEQGTALEKVLVGWMGEISQIDDILVMGLRMDQQ